MDCLLAGIGDDKLNSPEIEQLKQDVYEAFEPFYPHLKEDGLPENPDSLDFLVTAVFLAQEKGELVPNEFKIYIRSKCMSKLRYSEAKRAVERFHPYASKEDIQDQLDYLNDLRRLRLAVKALYQKVDPKLVVNDKSLSRRYKEFKNHYAYETVFGFIIY